MSPADAAAALRALGAKGLKRAITNGMKRGLSVGRAQALKDLRSKGVGRALWLRRNSKKKGISGTPPLVVTVGKVRQSGGEYSSSLQEKGMAALIEKGGRTKAHKIQAKGSKLLHFGSGGRWSFAKVVSHPGSMVQAQPHLARAAAAAGAAIPPQIDAGITAAIREVGL